MPSSVNRGVVELETGPADDISVRLAQRNRQHHRRRRDAARRPGDRQGAAAEPGRPQISCAASTWRSCRPMRSITRASSNLLPGYRTRSPMSPNYTMKNSICWRAPTSSTIADLAEQTVNVDLHGSGTAITATRLFDLLKITAQSGKRQPGGGAGKTAQGRDRRDRLPGGEAGAVLPGPEAGRWPTPAQHSADPGGHRRLCADPDHRGGLSRTSSQRISRSTRSRSATY